jgi:hypothetical protein
LEDYDCTPEKFHLIINYDFKYRMGLTGEEDEESNRRGIPPDILESVLNNPDQIVDE